MLLDPIFDDEKSNSQASTEPKSKFQEVLELVTPAERMQMIQLGLNPFMMEDVQHFKELQSKSKPGTFNFFQRLAASLMFIFRNKFNETLQIEALRYVNSGVIGGIKKTKPVPVSENKNEEEVIKQALKGKMKEAKVTKDVWTDLESFKKAYGHKEPNNTVTFKDYLQRDPVVPPHSSADSKSFIDLKKFKEREEEEIKKLQELNLIPKAKEGFIPGPVPIVFEENEGLLKVGKEASKSSTLKVAIPKKKVARRRGEVVVPKSQHQVSKTKRKKK